MKFELIAFDTAYILLLLEAITYMLLTWLIQRKQIEK